MPPVCPGNGRNGPRVAESRDRILIAKWLGLRSCVTVPEAGGNSSVVEHDLAKVGVAGSNPVSRSITCTVSSVLTSGRRSQVAKAEVCKTSIQRFESARRLHYVPAGFVTTLV